jgi:hypothetical protein
LNYRRLLKIGKIHRAGGLQTSYPAREFEILEVLSRAESEDSTAEYWNRPPQDLAH